MRKSQEVKDDRKYNQCILEIYCIIHKMEKVKDQYKRC